MIFYIRRTKFQNPYDTGFENFIFAALIRPGSLFFQSMTDVKFVGEILYIVGIICKYG